MPGAMYVVIGWMIFVPLTMALAVLWAYKKHQFDDIEEPKYHILEDRQPEPWPHQKGG